MTLTYYPDSEPGITRRKHGRGFTYTAPDGTRIDRGPERVRLEAMAVPPAYSDVWMSPLEKGHLMATGRDVRARKQYRYHPDWSSQRAITKFDRLADFGRTLPRLRRWITTRLQGEVGERDTAIAAVLALIDRGSLRPGHPDYTDENGSFGATTLRGNHIDIDAYSIALSYTAKGGKSVRKTLQGSRLAQVLDDSADLPGATLLSYIGQDGDTHPVRSEQLTEVMAELCGDGMTPKSMRTWNGTHAAFQRARQTGPLTIAALADAASDRLHNTPTIARNSYIHPDVIGLAEHTETDRDRMLAGLRPETASGLRKGEAELLSFLDT